MRLATEDHSGQPLLILERAVVLIHFGDHIEKADVIASLVVVDSSTTNLAALCTNRSPAAHNCMCATLFPRFATVLRHWSMVWGLMPPTDQRTHNDACKHAHCSDSIFIGMLRLRVPRVSEIP